MFYLLRHFNDVTHKNIPKLVVSCMNDILKYSAIQRFDSDFLDQKFDHPIILFRNYNNNNQQYIKELEITSDFKIYYIS